MQPKPTQADDSEPGPEPKPNISLLIADDHPMVRKGLRTMLSLSGLPYNFLIDEASDGEEAVANALKGFYDLVITDYNLPVFKGDEVTRRILFHKPNARVLVLSNYDERSFMRSSYEAGVKGYLTKDVDVDYLVKCIGGVMKGKRFFPPNFLEDVSEDVAVVPWSDPWQRQELKRFGFTERELQVLRLIIAQQTSSQIGETLEISRRTVDVYRSHLLSKTGSKNAAGLMQFAVRHGLV